MIAAIAIGLFSFEAAHVAAYYGAPLAAWHTVAFGATAGSVWLVARLLRTLRDIERTPMP